MILLASVPSPLRLKVSQAPNGAGRIPSPLHAVVVWLIALAALLLVSVAVAAIAVAIALGSGADKQQLLRDPSLSPMLAKPLWFVVGALASQATVIVVLVAALSISKLDQRVILPVSVPAPSVFFGALLVVFGLAPLAQSAGELVLRLTRTELTAALIVEQVTRRANGFELVLLFFTLAVVPALVEEAMFRGFMTAAFSTRSVAAALVVPSLLFGVFHLEPTQAAGTAVLGIGFGLARLYGGSLLPSMLAHGAYNSAVIAALRFTPVSDDHQIRVVPIFIGIALAVVGVVLLRRGSALSFRAKPENSPQSRV